MDITRAQIELMLRGKHSGLLGPSVPIERLGAMAAALLDRCGRAWFADPDVIAAVLGLAVVEARLPTGLDFLCNGTRLLVRSQNDPSERGLLVLRGVASHHLAVEIGRHTEADVILLVAELAVPSSLIARSGMTLAADRYEHVPSWFLQAWERFLVGPPSSHSISRA